MSCECDIKTAFKEMSFVTNASFWEKWIQSFEIMVRIKRLLDLHARARLVFDIKAASHKRYPHTYPRVWNTNFEVVNCWNTISNSHSPAVRRD